MRKNCDYDLRQRSELSLKLLNVLKVFSQKWAVVRSWLFLNTEKNNNEKLIFMYNIFHVPLE